MSPRVVSGRRQLERLTRPSGESTLSPKPYTRVSGNPIWTRIYLAIPTPRTHALRFGSATVGGGGFQRCVARLETRIPTQGGNNVVLMDILMDEEIFVRYGDVGTQLSKTWDMYLHIV